MRDYLSSVKRILLVAIVAVFSITLSIVVYDPLLTAVVLITGLFFGVNLMYRISEYKHYWREILWIIILIISVVVVSTIVTNGVCLGLQYSGVLIKACTTIAKNLLGLVSLGLMLGITIGVLIWFIDFINVQRGKKRNS